MELKHMQMKPQVLLREVKEQYRRKLKQRLQNNSMKDMWDGMEIITACNLKQGATIKGDMGSKPVEQLLYQV